MPQMAPIWWTTLFSMFILSYTMYMIHMYFNVKYDIKTSDKPQIESKMNMNWLW